MYFFVILLTLPISGHFLCFTFVSWIQNVIINVESLITLVSNILYYSFLLTITLLPSIVPSNLLHDLSSLDFKLICLY